MDFWSDVGQENTESQHIPLCLLHILTVLERHTVTVLPQCPTPTHFSLWNLFSCLSVFPIPLPSPFYSSVHTVRNTAAGPAELWQHQKHQTRITVYNFMRATPVLLSGTWERVVSLENLPRTSGRRSGDLEKHYSLSLSPQKCALNPCVGNTSEWASVWQRCAWL